MNGTDQKNGASFGHRDGTILTLAGLGSVSVRAGACSSRGLLKTRSDGFGRWFGVTQFVASPREESRCFGNSRCGVGREVRDHRRLDVTVSREPRQDVEIVRTTPGELGRSADHDQSLGLLGTRRRKNRPLEPLRSAEKFQGGLGIRYGSRQADSKAWNVTAAGAMQRTTVTRWAGRTVYLSFDSSLL